MQDNPWGLVPRELEVLTLVAQGLSNGQIAERMVISEHSVANYNTVIHYKMRVQNRTQAAVTWVRWELEQQAKDCK